MTTIYREYDTNSRTLKVLNPSVSGGVRGDDNSLKIQFIYTDDTYLEDKKAYIVFDVVDPDTQNLYTFSEDTTPKFDGYVFTVPAELLQMKGITNGYIHFQLGFIGLSDSIGDVEFSQSQIDYLEFNAANTLIVRDTLASDLSQAPTYYAWAEYYKEHGLLDKIEKEETETGCILHFQTYSEEPVDVPLNYIKLDSEGKISDSIFPKITVEDTHKRLAGISGDQRDKLLQLMTEKTYGAYVETDSTGQTESIVYYITEPSENGQASLTKYYVMVEEEVGDGTTDTVQVWYVYDPLTESIKQTNKLDAQGQPIIVDGENVTEDVRAEELTATDKAKLIAIGHDSAQASREVYGYVMRNFNGTSTPVFYIIDTETGAYSYYTYEDVVASDGITTERTWYKCDENGIIDTYIVTTETTEIAFEQKENKISQWSEYSESIHGQYPSAKLVYDSLKGIGITESTLVPYTYVNGQAITGNHPVEGGAIYDAIENEAVARKTTDRHLRGDITENTLTIAQLRTEFDADHTTLASTKAKADGHDTQITALDTKVTDCETLTQTTATELRTEMQNNIDKYFVDTEAKKSILTQRLQDTVTSLDNTVTNTTRSLYQQMNLLKEEVNSNLVSSITSLQTDVTGLKTASTTQATNLATLTQNYTTLAETVKSMGDNLSIDFSKYDLVTVDKTTGTIDENLLPDTAITEYFGPVSSKSALTTVQRKKVIAKVEKIPVYEDVMTKVDVTPEPVPKNEWVLVDCPVVYNKKIGNETYEITKEVYSVDENNELTLAYMLCPQYESSAFAFYDGTQIDGVALPKYYASKILAPTPKYTIFQGTTSNALYSLSAEVVSTRTEVRTVQEKQYNTDGTVKTDEDGAPIVLEVEKEVTINTYKFYVDNYASVGKHLLTGVADKALGATYPSGQVDLKEISETGTTDIYRFYSLEEQEPVYIEQATGEKIPKTDSLGAIIYDTEDNVRMIEPSMVSYLGLVDTNVKILPRNRYGNVFSLIEDGNILYLTPLDGEDYGEGVTIGTKNFKINSVDYSCTKVSRIVGGTRQDVCEFYVVDANTDATYTIQKTVKTTTTYTTEYVYPQRGDMCVVRGSSNPSEDGTYLLGLADFDGHTYSSVIEHWVKLSSPQAYWGQIMGNPLAGSISGVEGTIEDQKDLMAILDAKSVKFDAENGVNLTYDEVSKKYKLGHEATSGEEYGMGTFTQSSINALGVTVDPYGHVKSMKETIIYPPTSLGEYSADNGSDYWGIAQDTNGKNVCQWIRPLSSVIKNNNGLVTSAGIWQSMNDIKSQAIGEAKSAVASKQNNLAVVVVELAEESWGADGTNGYVSTKATGNSIITSSCNFMITFDTEYLEDAIDACVKLDSSPSPTNGSLKFRANKAPRGAIRVNVLVIPRTA